MRIPRKQKNRLKKNCGSIPVLAIYFLQHLSRRNRDVTKDPELNFYVLDEEIVWRFAFPSKNAFTFLPKQTQDALLDVAQWWMRIKHCDEWTRVLHRQEKQTQDLILAGEIALTIEHVPHPIFDQ